MRKTRITLLGIVLIAFFYMANGQAATPITKHTISGTIRDKKSGEVLIGASIYLLEVQKSGTTSNSYGFYSITAPAGNYTLMVSFAGYQLDSIKVDLTKNTLQPIELVQNGSELETVIVSSTR